MRRESISTRCRAELTYGLERIAAFLQDVDSIYDIVWARDPKTGKEVTYGDVRLADELQFSVYNFELADVDELWKHLELFEAECQELLSEFAKLAAEKKEAGKKERTVDEDFPAHLREQIRRFPLLAGLTTCA